MDNGPAAVADVPGIRASLEAVLLVADEPVPAELLAQVVDIPAHVAGAARLWPTC